MPYKVFAAGEEALASDVNSYLMSQTVSRHASASARSSAITAPTKGQMTVLDTDVFQPEIYTGSAWAPLGGFYMRWFHQVGWGPFAPNVTGVGLQLPAIALARTASLSFDLEVYVTNSTGTGDQSANFQLAISSGAGAATFAPISVFSLSPFRAISLPIKGFWRNVAAGSNLQAQVTLSVGTGSATIDIGAISGSVTAFPPGSEY